MTVPWTVFPHPRYSPDLVPSDFHLFGPLQDALEDVLCMMRAETQCVAGLLHLKCVDNGGDLT